VDEAIVRFSRFKTRGNWVLAPCACFYVLVLHCHRHILVCATWIRMTCLGDEEWYQSILTNWTTSSLHYDMDDYAFNQAWVPHEDEWAGTRDITEQYVNYSEEIPDQLAIITEADESNANKELVSPSSCHPLPPPLPNFSMPLLQPTDEDEPAAIIRNAEAILSEFRCTMSAKQRRQVSIRSMFSPGPSPRFMPPALKIEVQDTSLQLYDCGGSEGFGKARLVQQAFAQDIYVDEARLIKAPEYRSRNEVASRCLRTQDWKEPMGFAVTFKLVDRLYHALLENENFQRLFVDCYGSDTVAAILRHLTAACHTRTISGYIYIPHSNDRNCISRDPDAGFNQCVQFKLCGDTRQVRVAHPWRGLLRRCKSHASWTGIGSGKGCLTYEPANPHYVLLHRHAPLCCQSLQDINISSKQDEEQSSPARTEVRWCPNNATETCHQDSFAAASLRKATDVLYRERHGEVPSNTIRHFVTFLQLTADTVEDTRFKYTPSRPLVLMRISVLRALFKTFRIRFSD
jgi:hypothetical protein